MQWRVNFGADPAHPIALRMLPQLGCLAGLCAVVRVVVSVAAAVGFKPKFGL